MCHVLRTGIIGYDGRTIYYSLVMKEVIWMSVVGLDIGRRNVKVYDGVKFVHFPSVIGEWRDLKLKNDFGSKAFVVEFNGEKYFAGVLAERESEFSRQMLLEDKVHGDTLLLALIALWHFVDGNTERFDIVTGLPVNMHDNENKRRLMNLLIGDWIIRVNGVEKEIKINEVRVAVECGAAFWSNPRDGLVRLLDGGSKTINFVTMLDKRYVDRDSGTLSFGFDTNKSLDLRQLSARIAGELGKKWTKDDEVFVIGGQADNLVNLLKGYFPKIRKLHTGKWVELDNMVDLNLFANAIGYFNIGKAVLVNGQF